MQVLASDPERLYDRLRTMLCRMQSTVQAEVIRRRDASTIAELSGVSHVTEADTIYRVDTLAEAAILDWFERHWPTEHPVELLMEGLEGRGPVTFPSGTKAEACAFLCLVDPIDGTRCFMHDKRSAWVLAGIAPHAGAGTRLSGIVAASMTELPVRKQRLADQLSVTRGAGPAGVHAERTSLDDGSRSAAPLEPSAATDLQHGFATFSRFLPPARVLISEFEAAVLARLHAALGGGEGGTSMVFEDQYISSAGQLHGLMSGRDRLIADLRPEAMRRLGLPVDTVAHPYDLCTALIMEELGCPIIDARGEPLDAPMDTTTPVSWVGFANAELANRAWPVIAETISEFF